MMPFGKYQGMKFEAIPVSYLRWLLDQDWLRDELRKTIQDYLCFASHPADQKTTRRKKKMPLQTAAEKYDQQNREAAEIIATDPKRYEGFCLEWAKLWLHNHPANGYRKTGNSLWKEWRDAGKTIRKTA